MKKMILTAEMKAIQGRQIAALLNPRPAVLVTVCDASGTPNVLTLAWLTPLSHEPPLLGISVGRSRYSHELICATGEFAVNVVGDEFREAVELCGSHSGRDLDKARAAGLIYLPARHIRPPVIDGALAHLECRVVDQIAAGDHTFFIGQALDATAQAACFSDRWMQGAGGVLLCVQRDEYGRWP